PEEIIIQGDVVHPGCTDNGSIILSVTGGVAPYTFSRKNGLDLDSLKDLGSGSYTVAVTDAANCTNSASFTLSSEGTSLTSFAEITPSNCGQENGGIILTTSGGEAPYTYKWSHGSIEKDQENLAPGQYQVIVSDVAGCTYQNTYTIREHNTLN